MTSRDVGMSEERYLPLGFGLVFVGLVFPPLPFSIRINMPLSSGWN